VDATTERVIFELLRKLKEAGKTLVVVNHDLSAVDEYDSLVMINQRVVAFGPTKEVFVPEKLRETYGGQLTILQQAEQLMVVK